MNYLNLYANFLKRLIGPRKRLTVVFDSSNGTTGPVLKRAFKHHLVKSIYLNSRPDGNFPAHGPDPTKEEAIAGFQAAVKKNKADIGVAFDADGDRAVFIDNLGRVVSSDTIIYLLIWHLNPKKAVIDAWGGWLIKKIMRKRAVDLGGENSGHYNFKEFFYCDSGIFTAVQVINAISKLPYQFSDFINFLPSYYRSKLSFPIRGDKDDLIKKIRLFYEKQSPSISRLDGLTMIFKDWWFNLRPSNTEPIIKLYLESTVKNLLTDKTKELKNLIVSF